MESTGTATLTVITSDIPAHLAKEFKLVDGKLIKTATANMTRGRAERRPVKDLDDLAGLVTGLNSSQALTYGVCDLETAYVLTKSEFHKPHKPHAPGAPLVCRTRDHFKYLEDAGFMIFDIDPAPGAPAPQTADAVREMLTGVCPDLAAAPIAIRPSAGSFIYNGDVELIGAKGWRVWIPVLNAADIPRAGQIFFERCWLSGLGWIGVSKSGSYLIRGPVDATVWQPERLDFAGPAVCEPPLEQRKPAPVLYNKDAGPFDTVLIKSLTPTETAALSDLIREAKDAKRPESQAAKDLWVDERVNEAVKKEKITPSETRLEEIKNIFSSAVKQRTLYAEFIIQFLDGTSATVEQILNEKEKYHLFYCRDPLEPDLNTGRARLQLLGSDKSHLWAFTHGGSRFTLTRARKEIFLQPGERNRMADELLTTAKVDGTLYTRGGELVRVTDTGAIMPVNLDGLLFFLDGLAKFQKFNKKEDEWKAADCPRDLATAVSVCAKLSGTLPELRAVINHPTMDPATRRVVSRDGYDKGTGLLVWLNGEDWPSIPDTPNRETCNKAAQDLYRPFHFFPFAGPVDLGVFISALLTAVIRPLLPTAPGFCFTAPAAGTGKTLAAVCAAIIAGENRPAVMPGGSQKDDEEIRKKLFAVLREGAGVLIFDNINGVFSSDSVCAMLTNETFKDRILCVSNTVAVSSATTLFLTGNNLTLAGDLCRRILTCRIDSKTELPWKRQFAFDPATYCREHRAEMIGAALTLLKGGLLSDYRLTAGMGSFNEWNDSIRKTVCWIGDEGFLPVDDPVKSIDSAFEADPETAKIGSLAAAWFDVFGDAPATVAACISAANEYDGGTYNSAHRRHPALFDAIDEIAGDRGNINPRRLGRWIERQRDRIIDGLSFELKFPQKASCRHA
ncbi:MAG: hypothetical protein WA081_19720 [Desulfosalsimonadaceae bacterium]